MRRYLKITIPVVLIGWGLLVYIRVRLFERRAVHASGLSWPLPKNWSVDVPFLTFVLNPIGPDPSAATLNANGNPEKLIILDSSGHEDIYFFSQNH